MNFIPRVDKHGGAVCEGPHVRFCERPMNFMGLLYFLPSFRFREGAKLRKGECHVQKSGTQKHKKGAGNIILE